MFNRRQLNSWRVTSFSGEYDIIYMTEIFNDALYDAIEDTHESNRSFRRADIFAQDIRPDGDLISNANLVSASGLRGLTFGFFLEFLRGYQLVSSHWLLESGSSDWNCWHGRQKVHLPLKVEVALVLRWDEGPGSTASHIEFLVQHGKVVLHVIISHHHVLSDGWGGWGGEDRASPGGGRASIPSLHTVHGTRLLETTVPHLDAAQLVLWISGAVWSQIHASLLHLHLLPHALFRKPGAVPGILHGTGVGVWTELLHVGISERTVVGGWYLYELPPPLVSPLERLVLHLSLWPERLQSRVALEPWCIAEGAHWLGCLEGSGLGGAVKTEVVVAADSLDDFSTGKLDIRHPVVVDCTVGHLQS